MNRVYFTCGNVFGRVLGLSYSCRAALLLEGKPNGLGRMLSGWRYGCGGDNFTVCVVDCFTESYSMFALSV
jgi:hypothetical protein